MKEKLKKLKDEYLKAEYVVPSLIAGFGAGAAYCIGYSKGLKCGVTGAFKHLVYLAEATKD